MPRKRRLPETVPSEELASVSQVMSYVRYGLDLTDAQRRFLANRTRFDTDTACAESIGLSKHVADYWRRDSAAFREADARLREYGVEALAAILFRDQMARAAQVNSDLLDAKTFKVSAGEFREVDDNQARGKAVETALRVAGLWNREATPKENGDRAAQAIERFTQVLADTNDLQRAFAAGAEIGGALPSQKQSEPQPGSVEALRRLRNG